MTPLTIARMPLRARLVRAPVGSLVHVRTIVGQSAPDKSVPAATLKTAILAMHTMMVKVSIDGNSFIVQDSNGGNVHAIAMQ